MEVKAEQDTSAWLWPYPPEQNNVLDWKWYANSKFRYKCNTWKHTWWTGESVVNTAASQDLSGGSVHVLHMSVFLPQSKHTHIDGVLLSWSIFRSLIITDSNIMSDPWFEEKLCTFLENTLVCSLSPLNLTKMRSTHSTNLWKAIDFSVPAWCWNEDRWTQSHTMSVKWIGSLPHSPTPPFAF